MWLLVLLFVPETYHPALLRKQARILRKKTGDDQWHAPIEKLDRSVSMVRLVFNCRPREYN